MRNRLVIPLLIALFPAAGCVTAALNGEAEEDHAPDLLEDARITREVRMRLYRDAFVGDERFTVSTERGVVTVIGKVDNRSHANRIMEIVRGVDGVRDIHLQLQVTDTP